MGAVCQRLGDDPVVKGVIFQIADHLIILLALIFFGHRPAATHCERSHVGVHELPHLALLLAEVCPRARFNRTLGLVGGRRLRRQRDDRARIIIEIFVVSILDILRLVREVVFFNLVVFISDVELWWRSVWHGIIFANWRL